MKNLGKTGLIWNEKQPKRTVNGFTRTITVERTSTSAVPKHFPRETNISRALRANTLQARTTKVRPASTRQANTILRADTVHLANTILLTNTPPAPNKIAVATKTDTVRPVPKVLVTQSQRILRQRTVTRVRLRNAAVMKVLIGISQKNLRSKHAEAYLVFSYCITYLCFDLMFFH